MLWFALTTLGAAATDAPKSLATPDAGFQTVGIVANLPVFTERLMARVHHSMSWT